MVAGADTVSVCLSKVRALGEFKFANVFGAFLSNRASSAVKGSVVCRCAAIF